MATQKSSGNSRRILATVGVIGALGAIGGLGTYSAWSSSVAPAQNLSTQTLNLTASGSNFTTDATGLVPGDTVDRVVDIVNANDTFGSMDFSSVSAAPNSLDTALTMQVDTCSVAWTGSPTTGYTCGGTATSIVGAGAVNRSVTGVTGMNSLAAGTDHVRVRLVFSNSAPDTMQGKSASVTYTFTGNQRTAGYR